MRQLWVRVCGELRVFMRLYERSVCVCAYV